MLFLKKALIFTAFLLIKNISFVGMVLDNFSIDKSNHNALQKTPRQLKKCK
jgi:hypothetical protein